MTDEIRPFFEVVASETRPLGAVLPALVTPAVTSPWSPRPTEEVPAPPALPAPSADELAATHDEAREHGHAEGLAETAALREHLARAVTELAAAEDAIVAPAAELIAEIAACVIETWVGNADRSAMFAPLVRGWLARPPGHPATARVHPDDAGALATAIADAPIAIVGDPALARGALEIRSATLELFHDWPTRVTELRTAMIAAITGSEP